MTATPKPNPLLAESIRTSFLSGTRHSSSVQVDQFLTSIARHPLAWGGSISSNLSLGESSLEWKLARSHLATALTLHLVHCELLSDRPLLGAGADHVPTQPSFLPAAPSCPSSIPGTADYPRSASTSTISTPPTKYVLTCSLLGSIRSNHVASAFRLR